MSSGDESHQTQATATQRHSFEWGRLWLTICVTGSVAGAINGLVAASHYTHVEMVELACTIFQIGLLAAVPFFVFVDEGSRAKIAIGVFVLVAVTRLVTPAYSR